MSENSRSRVTVTFGRSDRVVKRGGEVSEDRYSNGVLMTGSKRSIRDRLGGDSDDRNQNYYKRQRGESLGTSSLNDMHLDKHDLRYKLLQKNKGRKSNDDDSCGNIDLRDKLLRKTSQPSVRNKTVHHLESAVSTRQRVPVPIDTHMMQHQVLEPQDTCVLGCIPSSRNARELSLLGPVRTYSSWSLDNLRRRSPERLLQPSASRGISSDKSGEDLPRRPVIRAYDDGRSSSGLRISPSKPISSPFLTRSSVTNASLKSVAPLPVQLYAQPGILQKIPSVGDDLPTVEHLLQYLGLEKYAILFKAEEIDMNALRQLGDSDLKELGIPMVLLGGKPMLHPTKLLDFTGLHVDIYIYNNNNNIPS